MSSALTRRRCAVVELMTGFPPLGTGNPGTAFRPCPGCAGVARGGRATARSCEKAGRQRVPRLVGARAGGRRFGWVLATGRRGGAGQCPAAPAARIVEPSSTDEVEFSAGWPSARAVVTAGAGGVPGGRSRRPSGGWPRRVVVSVGRIRRARSRRRTLRWCTRRCRCRPLGRRVGVGVWPSGAAAGGVAYSGGGG